MFYAIMKVEESRVAKYQQFEIEKDAAFHCRRFYIHFPDAFVHETTANVNDLYIEGKTITTRITT
jgi:hypothetical protein